MPRFQKKVEMQSLSLLKYISDFSILALIVTSIQHNARLPERGAVQPPRLTWCLEKNKNLS